MKKNLKKIKIAANFFIFLNLPIFLIIFISIIFEAKNFSRFLKLIFDPHNPENFLIPLFPLFFILSIFYFFRISQKLAPKKLLFFSIFHFLFFAFSGAALIFLMISAAF